jgi:hypothetical protein
MRQHASAYVSIHQHTSAYVSIRQEEHTGTEFTCLTNTNVRRQYKHSSKRTSQSTPLQHAQEETPSCQHTSAYVSIRQHTSAYVSIRQHQQHLELPDAKEETPSCQHTSAYVSIRHLLLCSTALKPKTAVFRDTNTNKSSRTSQPALFQNFFTTSGNTRNPLKTKDGFRV